LRVGPAQVVHIGVNLITGIDIDKMDHHNFAEPKAQQRSAKVPLLSRPMYLLIGFRKSIPPQNRQRIVYYYRLNF
jgi:hypothetical protein